MGKDVFRAYVTNLTAPSTHSVPVIVGQYMQEFASIEAARDGVNKYIAQFSASFPTGYRAFILDWNTMAVVAWGEKPQPLVLVWRD